jgi:polysaccharide pyruvyl transferase WcaK-like protein
MEVRSITPAGSNDVTGALNPGADKPVHVLLYALIPSDRACAPLRRGPVASFRNMLRRVLDLAAWRLLGLWRAHYSTFKDALNTNRGDIAIRMAVRKHVAAAFAGRAVTFTEVAWGELDKALSLEPDLVVLAGGGFLFADRQGCLPARFKADVDVLSRLSCPVAAASIGLNKLIEAGEAGTFRFHPESAADLIPFLHRLTKGAVRDEQTQQALALPGFAKLPVIVDPVFLLASERLVAKPRAAAANGALSIGINLAFHGGQTSALSHRVLPIVTRVLNRLRRETGCRFFYFLHSDGERGIARALRLCGLPIELVDTDVGNMLETYRGMDFHIGQMLHSAIFAMSVGTPTLALAYDIKAPSFFELFGLSQWCLDATTLDEAQMWSAVRAMMESRHEVATSIIRHRMTLAKQSRDFYAEIAALVPVPAGSGVQIGSSPVPAPYAQARRR